MIYRALRRLDVGDDAGPDPWLAARRRRPVRRRQGVGLSIALVAAIVLPAVVVVVLIRPEALIDGSVELRMPRSFGTGSEVIPQQEPEPQRAMPLPADAEVAGTNVEPAVPTLAAGAGRHDTASAATTAGAAGAAGPVELQAVELAPSLTIPDSDDAGATVTAAALPDVMAVTAVPGQALDTTTLPIQSAIAVESVTRALKPESALRAAAADEGVSSWQKLSRWGDGGTGGTVAMGMGGAEVQPEQDLLVVADVSAADGSAARARQSTPVWPDGQATVGEGGSASTSTASDGDWVHVPASVVGHSAHYGDRPQQSSWGSVGDDYGSPYGSEGYVTGTAWSPADRYGDGMMHGEESTAGSGDIRMSVDQVARGRMMRSVAQDLNRAIRRGDTALADELMAILSDMAGAHSTIVLKTRAYRHLVEDDGQDAIAMQLLNEVLIRDPSDLDASLNLALLEIRSGLIGDARSRLDDLARVHPDDQRILAMQSSLR